MSEKVTSKRFTCFVFIRKSSFVSQNFGFRLTCTLCNSLTLTRYVISVSNHLSIESINHILYKRICVFVYKVLTSFIFRFNELRINSSNFSLFFRISLSCGSKRFFFFIFPIYISIFYILLSSFIHALVLAYCRWPNRPIYFIFAQQRISYFIAYTLFNFNQN